MTILGFLCDHYFSPIFSKVKIIALNFTEDFIISILSNTCEEPFALLSVCVDHFCQRVKVRDGTNTDMQDLCTWQGSNHWESEVSLGS